VTVARDIVLADRYENMGAQLLKAAAIKTNDIAGDGTTTATVLAQALVNEGLKNMAAGADPMLMRRGLEKAIAAVSAAIKKQAIRIGTRAELADVATIAAQNPEIGELVAEILHKVGPDGAVTIEEGHGLLTQTEYMEGMQFDRGYLSPFFITHAEAMETVLDEPYLLICDQKIYAAADLVPLLEKFARLSHRNLVVIADDISGEALTTLVLNKLSGTFNLVAVKAPGFGEQRQAMLQDLALLTGGTLVSEAAGRPLKLATLADLGSCDKVMVTKDKTTLIGGHGDETALKGRINQIKIEIAQTAGTYKKERYQERLARLMGGVAVIKVGAATSVELGEKKQRVEDALNATRAAVEQGIVPGGGVALLNAISALAKLTTQATDEEATAVAIVSRALEEPMRTLACNAGLDGAVIVANVRRRQLAEKNDRIGYNVMSEQYEDMVQAGIMDPAKVICGALESAASMAVMILTIEGLVADNHQ
jgi:chaperonin GroEL